MGKRKEPTHKPVPCGVWVSKKREKQLLLPQPKRARLSSVTVIPARQTGGARELPKRQATIMEIFGSRGRKDADAAAATSGTSLVYGKGQDQKTPDSENNYSTAQKNSRVDLKSKEWSEEDDLSFSFSGDSQDDQPLSPLNYTQDSEGNLRLKTPSDLLKSKNIDDVFAQNQTVNNSIAKQKETLHSSKMRKPSGLNKSCENVRSQKTRAEKMLQQIEKHEVLSPPMYTLNTQGDLKVKWTTEQDCPQTGSHQNVLHEKLTLDTMPCTEELSPLQYTLDSQGELVHNENHHYHSVGMGNSEESHPLTCGPIDADSDDDSQLLEPEDFSELKYTLDTEGDLRCKEN
ncbi:uncharacterized protein LOC144883185 [Branchiostoma floridae x Branchiostoma japonicum]